MEEHFERVRSLIDGLSDSELVELVFGLYDTDTGCPGDIDVLWCNNYINIDGSSDCVNCWRDWAKKQVEKKGEPS